VTRITGIWQGLIELSSDEHSKIIVEDRCCTASGDFGSETLERDAWLAVIVFECYVHRGGETMSGSNEDSRITNSWQVLVEHTLKEPLMQLSNRAAVLKVQIMQSHSFELTNEGGR
jgi:hypothetical protein